jgi:DNA mismatch endonuclease (patch repair protein)
MKETPELRSRIMRAVKSGDTAPELIVRSLAHRMGYRFRLRREDLPGKPDLVFPKLRKAIFVHGCFWHGHDCARGARVPKNNREYWTKKIDRNQERDKAARQALAKSGWQVAVFWECALRKDSDVRALLRKFLCKPAGRKD